MFVRPHVSLLVLVLAFACADDDGSAPGHELGPCVQERFCEQPLVCTDGICVHPDQLADEGPSDASVSVSGDDGRFDDDGHGDDGSRLDMGGGTWPGDDGSAEGEAEGGDGGAEVYCTTDSSSGGCFCGHTADYGPLGQPCSESTVPSPSQCCASEGWPGYGGCSCWSLSCRRISSDTCYCGIGLVDAEDEAVSSCTPDGGVCCRDGEASCGCWPGLTACPPDEQQVATCTVAELACGDSTKVSACN